MSAEALLGRDLNGLDTPTLVVDLEVLERNVRTMARFASENGVSLRPHAKSHKTLGIARRQTDAGAVGLTVAKLDEADAFLAAGFSDLLVANEVVGPLKWRRLATLNARGRVAVGVDALDVAAGIAAAAREIGVVVPVLVEVDTGLHRAGTQPGEPTFALAEQLARLEGVDLRGVFTHAGHAYAAASVEEVRRIGRDEGELLVQTAQLLRARGLPCPVVSVGSTPTAFTAGSVSGVTEVRAGNYVFYDRMQVALGSARLEDCSLSVLSTVISRPAPDRAVIDAGSKTFALDRGAHGLDALRGYGLDRSIGVVVDRLSEEHGILQLTSDDDQRVRVGTRLRVVPNHACTVANLAETLVGVRDGVVTEVLPVLVRGGGR
jgi:D-serine deaminase-like pyridoxal phosphate-dependent protein